MKNLMNLNGAQELSKAQLQTINGGGDTCTTGQGCVCDTVFETFCCNNCGHPLCCSGPSCC